MNSQYTIRGAGLYYDMSSEAAGWLQGKPYNYDQLEISGDAMRITDPHSRRAVSTSPPYGEEVDPWVDDHPPANGGIYPGIGWMGRNMGVNWRPDVEITWSGLWDIHEGYHIETTPLLWIDESNPLGGFGAWPITYAPSEVSAGAPAFAIGFIGSPPELFDTVQAPVLRGLGFSHTDGTPRSIRIRLTESDEVELLLDGSVIWSLSISDSLFTSVTGFTDLMQSSVHGVAIDAHLVRPISDVPNHDGALDVTFHNWPR